MIEERVYGHLVLDSRLGYGVRILGPAPEFARVSLRLFNGWAPYIQWISDESVMINNQVSYKIVGCESRPSALVLQLIHDYRPEAGA